MDLGLTQTPLVGIVFVASLVGLAWGIATSGREYENAFLDREFLLDTATPARRLGGNLVDSMILGPTVALAFASPLFIWLPAVWVIWFAMVARHGQTPGKALVSTYVITGDGTVPPWWQMWIRELGIKWVLFGILNFLLGQIPWTIAALWCLWDDDKQCGWDKIARTYVAYSPLEPPVARVPTNRAASSLGNEELLELQRQRQRGTITAEQYETQRRRLLD